MKLERVKKDKVLIEMNEEELSIITEGLEEIANLKMLSDMDTIVFDYCRELEIMESQ
ncbi:hypothetical protein [Sporosarcina sp. G11-34]|uniref:hypothetical protein n=1 Tax=Sporosarcina sp. G11-34 TaxID=2849605 RepID=UPI0022A8FE27|nr:hypothetical protein [Sporosarcina sp. G11-34]MCZ2256903.1 hypothetical protein [Sporosarcina sp. G11-34]